MNEDQSLSKASKMLMYQEYFYGIFLVMLNKKWTTHLDTAGVCINGTRLELGINPEYWMKQSENHQVGLLKHECCHIIFSHLTDFGHLESKKIANWAMDLTINQDIGKDNLPPGGLFLDSFPKLNLEKDEGTESYYAKLIQGRDQGDPDVNGLLKATEEGGSFTNSNGNVIQAPEHKWEAMDELTEVERKLTQKQAQQLLKNAAEAVLKSRGTVPGNIALILEKLNEIPPPKLDWRGYLRRFIGKSQQVYTKKTQRKQSNRFIDSPGLKIKLKKHALVAWDTSGSVSDRELCEFHKEINHISRTGNDVTLIQADASIIKENIKKFNPKEDVLVKGRGGTSFQPVIDFYNKNKHKYSCLIYFTDGEAPNPLNADGNILWVLSEQSRKTDHLTGQIIQLN